MLSLPVSVLLYSAVLALAPWSLAANVQMPGLTVPAKYASNKQAVVTMFTETYEQYKKFAFGHDDLQPVSETFNDGRNGWGATIVDSLDTMFLMGLTDFFEEGVNFSAHIDFSQSQVEETVSLFETTIRYVAGLITAYQFSGSKYPVLIEKAKEVADKMVFAWVGDNDVPFGEMNFTTNQPVLETSNIAEAGTLSLEFQQLSLLTGNDTYRQLAEKSVLRIASIPDPLPGLPAQGIDPSTGEAVGGYVTWGGGSDSYFEYLIKYARLTNTDNPTFAKTWQQAVDSSIRFLARTSTVGDHQYLTDFNEGEFLHIGSHLECYNGGNWILGGRLLNNETIVNFGLNLVEACWNTYASTITGIGPETFAYISADGNLTEGDPPSAGDLAFYEKHGFYVFDGGSDYILRPEVLESNFYAWRLTGDTKYLDRAESAINSYNKFLKVNNAFTGINNVTALNSGFIDDTESFFYAEVLKYLFLTFDDPSNISLDEFVFNTECHPFKAPPAKASYSTGPVTAEAPAPFTVNAGALPAVSPNPHLPKQIEPLIHGGNNN